MGYYGGRGARLVTTLGPFEGKAQPVPTPGPKNLHECRWEPTARLDHPRRLAQRRLPGPAHDPRRRRHRALLAELRRLHRPRRSARRHPVSVLRQYLAGLQPLAEQLFRSTPIPRGSQGPWADVSFDRPYGREAQHEGVVNDPLTFGSGEFLPFEFPLAYWLEQHGYDVTLLLQQRHAHARPRPAVQGVHQRRPRRILGHPAIPQRRADARRGRQPAVPLGQCHLLGHPVSQRAATAGPTGSSSAAAPTAPTTTTPGDGERARPVPRARARRRAAHGCAERRAGQRRRRLDRRQARALDVRGHRAEERRPDSRA